MSVPTIVLVHGNFLGPWSWSDVAAKLQGTGFRTVTPDLPSADSRRQPRDDLHADAAAVREALGLLGPPVLGLLTGHCPNWSRPDLVADVLSGIAERISA